MPRVCKLLLLVMIIFFSKRTCSCKVRVQDVADTSQEPLKHSDTKQTNREEKAHSNPSALPGVVIKSKSCSDRNQQFNDFDFRNILESFLQPFPTLFHDDGKKPKVKTVVSLTEFINPKRTHSDILSSPFGFKESSLADDFFDIPKFMPFFPKCSIIDVRPIKHTKDKHGDNSTNLTDMECPMFPWRHHHTYKRDMNTFDSSVDNQKNKLFIKESDSPILGLGEIKQLCEGSMNNGNSENMVKERTNCMCLYKYLPFVEGAIGGVMFVLLILFIASWKVRKPNGIWMNVPFVDKSQYIEKV